MENFKQVLKRTTAVLMIAVLLIGIAPIGSLADVDWSEFALTASAAEREGYFTYYVSGGKAMIDYVDTGISGTVYVPSTLGGYPVTEIESSAFQRCKAMTSVIIPDSVLEIGNSAFYNCTGLTYVKLSENLSEIKSETFAGCEKITEITIPDSVTSIGTWAFQNCFSLVDVHIGKNVKSISNCAFYNCNGLKNIKIPNSVTSMGDSAFEHCSSLEDVIIGSGVTKLSYDLFCRCTALETIRIPASITSIEYSCKLFISKKDVPAAPPAIPSLHPQRASLWPLAAGVQGIRYFPPGPLWGKRKDPAPPIPSDARNEGFP